ncbi:unnamed protein product [Urochloa humidicola]
MAPPRVATGRSCRFHNQCPCSWFRRCSIRIPSVAPGRDYSCMPDGSDDTGAWSVLVGFISMSGNNSIFRLHRFHVARSGRVLGRSDDALELVDGIYYGAKQDALLPQIHSATATPGPDGRSVCLFARQVAADYKVRLRPLQLHLDLKRRINVSALPALPLGPTMWTRSISAAGNLWAPCFSDHVGPPLSSELTMKRLHKDTGRWLDVAAKNQPQVRCPPAGSYSGHVLHGYAVIGHTILMSLLPSHVFFIFDCSTCAWAAVATIETKNNHYIPIHERAVYAEEDDTIYFLRPQWHYGLCLQAVPR